MSKKMLMLGGAGGALEGAVQRQSNEEYLDRVTDAKASADDYRLAFAAKMTGPKATRPRAACLRKTAQRIAKGLHINGSWRSWKAV